MVVCKFYLQGFCKFGNNCRFEHNVPNYNSNINPIHQQQLQLSRQQQQQPQLSSNDFYELVRQELQAAETSGQWVLSCYCPWPSKSASLPSLNDHSPEELRYLIYSAQLSGNVESCKQDIQKLYQDAVMKRNIFKSLSPECKAILEQVRSGSASPVNNLFQNTPSNSSGASIFGGGGSQSPPQPSAPVSVFGGGGGGMQGNPFAAAAAFAPADGQAAIFGGSTVTPPPNPFLGQSSIFGGATAPAPIPTPVNPSASMFGGSFSGQPSIFGGQAGASTGNIEGSVFGGDSPLNSFSFAAAAQNQGLFPSTPASAPPLVPVPNGGSIFGGSPQPQPPVSMPVSAPMPISVPTPMTNPFGTPTQPQPQPPKQQGAPGPVAADLNAHTPFDQLTQQEKDAFLAPTFSSGCIPVRPPPPQLCT